MSDCIYTTLCHVTVIDVQHFVRTFCGKLHSSPKTPLHSQFSELIRFCTSKPVTACNSAHITSIYTATYVPHSHTVTHKEPAVHTQPQLLNIIIIHNLHFFWIPQVLSKNCLYNIESLTYLHLKTNISLPPHTFYLPKITSTTTVEIKRTKIFCYSLARKSTSENSIYTHPYYLLLKTDELYKCDLTCI